MRVIPECIMQGRKQVFVRRDGAKKNPAEAGFLILPGESGGE